MAPVARYLRHFAMPDHDPVAAVGLRPVDGTASPHRLQRFVEMILQTLVVNVEVLDQPFKLEFDSGCHACSPCSEDAPQERMAFHQ